MLKLTKGFILCIRMHTMCAWHSCQYQYVTFLRFFTWASLSRSSTRDISSSRPWLLLSVGSKLFTVCRGTFSSALHPMNKCMLASASCHMVNVGAKSVMAAQLLFTVMHQCTPNSSVTVACDTVGDSFYTGSRQNYRFSRKNARGRGGTLTGMVAIYSAWAVRQCMAAAQQQHAGSQPQTLDPISMPATCRWHEFRQCTTTCVQ